MPEQKNKVKFGLSKTYYAPMTAMADDGTATYGTPKALPGAVSLAISPEGDLQPFYADNITYWQDGGNSGYSGNWEVAKATEDFLVDILGYVKDDNGVLIENANAEVKPFALLFQMEGDIHGRRHVLYNCSATRPELSASTITDTKEPITDSIPISCKSVHIAALGIDTPKASVEQGDAAYATWYDAVYQTPAQQSNP